MHSKYSKNASRGTRLVTLGVMLCCGPYAAANDLEDQCNAMALSAPLGLKAQGKTERRLDNPNKVVVRAEEVADNFLNDSARVGKAQYINPYFSEAVIAKRDSSKPRTIRTGGSYVTSAKEFTSDGIKACIINAVIFPADGVDPVVQATAYRVPNINLQLVVPLKWDTNRKLIHFGGGGFNGEVKLPINVQFANFFSGDVQPLSQGYAMVQSDSGHRSETLFPESDLSFVRIPVSGKNASDEMVVKNFSGEHIKRVRDVSRAIIYRLTNKVPKRTYFVGFSTGGREALKAISQWGDDYDGAIAGAPAWDVLSGASTGPGCIGVNYLNPILAVSAASFLPSKILYVDYRKKQLCDLVNATSQPAMALESFAKRGGKLIAFQGTDDTVVPAKKTQLYWESLRESNSGLDNFARYYEIEKFNHGFGQVPHWNLIESLDTWVEKGTTPENQKLSYKLTDKVSSQTGISVIDTGNALPVPENAQEISPINWIPHTSEQTRQTSAEVRE